MYAQAKAHRKGAAPDQSKWMAAIDLASHSITSFCRTKNPFPATLQRRQKDPSPPPTRQSQLNYAMMKEGALRKKLQDIGIPNWGNKDLMKRRHIEWLNIFNSNCDADERVRKSKRQLVKELEEWENTQGGKADTKESKVMRKDFDGNGYAKSHKSDFDDLIAQARKKRNTPKADQKEGTNGSTEESAQDHTKPDLEALQDITDAPTRGDEQPNLRDAQDRIATQGLMTHGSDAEEHQNCEQIASHSNRIGGPETAALGGGPVQGVSTGSLNHTHSPSPKLPKPLSPEESIEDVNMSGS